MNCPSETRAYDHTLMRFCVSAPPRIPLPCWANMTPNGALPRRGGGGSVVVAHRANWLPVTPGTRGPVHTNWTTVLRISARQGFEPCLSPDLGQRAGIEPACLLSHAERQTLGLLYTLAGRTALANYRVVMRNLGCIPPIRGSELRIRPSSIPFGNNERSDRTPKSRRNISLPSRDLQEVHRLQDPPIP